MSLVITHGNRAGQLRCCVCDGVTVGRPCCSTHDCQGPLLSNKHHLCEKHKALRKNCIVVGCDTPAAASHKTCSNAEHRAVEEQLQRHDHAYFQLTERLRRAGGQTNDSLGRNTLRPQDSRAAAALHAISAHLAPSFEEGPGIGDDAELVMDINGHCEGKSEAGNRLPKARVGRRRTHNEQLCICACGIIIGRATFFGSESVNGVRVSLHVNLWSCALKIFLQLFLMKLFGYPNVEALPGVLFFDNNCQLWKLLHNLDNEITEEERTFFDSIALPVDVFHMEAKHKGTDTTCAQECNAASWPELRTEDGEWRFNSSIAEQTNAWFGGFQSMVREMQAIRYDFFLDEMINRRNEMVLANLERDGLNPHLIPKHVLLPRVPA
jgi:hypothetical protein